MEKNINTVLIKNLIRLNKTQTRILSNAMLRHNIEVPINDEMLAKAVSSYFSLRKSLPRLFLKLKIEDVFHLGRALGQVEVLLAILTSLKEKKVE